jgi:hypothetical protein
MTPQTTAALEGDAVFVSPTFPGLEIPLTRLWSVTFPKPASAPPPKG